MTLASPAGSSPRGSTRLTGGKLLAARLAWVLVTLLSLGKFALGTPLLFAETGQVCTSGELACDQGDSLSSAQLQAWEAAGFTLADYARAATGWDAFTSLVWFAIGVLIFLLRSDDWLALITSGMMVLFLSSGAESLIAGAYPGLGIAADLILNLGNILLFLFFALFPGGRFSPRWMRWYWLGMVLISITPSTFWYLNSQYSELIIAVFWISFLLLGPYSQIYRYRKTSSPPERLQTKWVVFGFVAFAGLLLIGAAVTSLIPNSLGRFLIDQFYFDLISLLIPLSIGVSVLRFRLYDIDVIIRKTLVYTGVTGLLALVFFGSVVLLQSLFNRPGGEQSPVVIVLSTLAIAALFNPLRRRVQEGVDRRFYRGKYDAEQALASFAAAARSEVEIERLSAALVGAVEETVRPEGVSLWLRGAEK